MHGLGLLNRYLRVAQAARLNLCRLVAQRSHGKLKRPDIPAPHGALFCGIDGRIQELPEILAVLRFHGFDLSRICHNGILELLGCGKTILVIGEGLGVALHFPANGYFIRRIKAVFGFPCVVSGIELRVTGLVPEREFGILPAHELAPESLLLVVFREILELRYALFGKGFLLLIEQVLLLGKHGLLAGFSSGLSLRLHFTLLSIPISLHLVLLGKPGLVALLVQCRLEQEFFVRIGLDRYGILGLSSDLPVFPLGIIPVHRLLLALPRPLECIIHERGLKLIALHLGRQSERLVRAHLGEIEATLSGLILEKRHVPTLVPFFDEPLDNLHDLFGLFSRPRTQLHRLAVGVHYYSH